MSKSSATFPALVLAILLPRAAAAADAATPRAADAFERLPLTFEENCGQADASVAFVGRAAGSLLVLGQGGSLVSSGPAGEFAMHLSGAVSSRAEGGESSSAVSNYLVGSRPELWLQGIPHVLSVRYRAVYPGIDLVYYGRGRSLEYDFQLAPGADPRAIALRFEGPAPSLARNGDLLLGGGPDGVRLYKPVAYQIADGVRRDVEARFELSGAAARIRVGKYDTRRALVIDPVLAYSTFLGGAGNDFGRAIAVDAGGSVFVTGGTNSASGFPLSNAAFPNYAGNTDAFVSRISANGTSLVYSTYLGGDSEENGTGIAIDGVGDAYVTGYTYSRNFPSTSGSFQPQHAPCPPQTEGCIDADAFVVKLSPNGSVLYATYLGGSFTDNGNAIAADASGNAYVTGFTDSTNFPLRNSLFRTKGALEDVFVTKLSPQGDSLVFSTFLGGAGDDFGYGIALDPQSNVYVAGSTNSDDFNGIRNAAFGKNNGNTDAFVVELAAAGNAVIFGTYLGGTDLDRATGIDVGSDGAAFVVGTTSSSDFPSGNSFGGASDAFLTKFAPGGRSVAYSLYLKSGGADFGNAVALDRFGNAVVAGAKPPPNPPGPRSSFDSTDAFVAWVNPDGNLVDVVNLGGRNPDTALGVATDGVGAVYVAGFTASPDFPVVNAGQGTFGGGSCGDGCTGDAFVAKIVRATDIAVTKTGPATANVGSNVTYTITVTNSSPNAAAQVSLADPAPAGLQFVSTTGDCTTTFPCNLGNLVAGATKTVQATFAIPPTYTGPNVIVNTATVTSGTDDSNTANNSDTARTTVAASADVSITNSGPASALAGTSIQFTLLVTNAGPGAAVGVTVANETPAGLTFTGTTGACTTPFPCGLGTLNPGESRTIVATYVVPAGYTSPDPIVDVATVALATADPNPANNSATSSVPLNAACVRPNAPINVAITAKGRPLGPVTGTDFLVLSWAAAAGGTPPTQFEVRFGGEPSIRLGAAVTSTEHAPVADNGGQPLQLFVRAIGCDPGLFSDEASSPPIVLSTQNASANFNAPSIVAPNSRVDFTDTSQRATSWLWFVDEAPFESALTQNFSHTFQTLGNHTVFQIASNGNGSNLQRKAVLVAVTGAPAAGRLEVTPLDDSDAGRQRLDAVEVRGHTMLRIAADDAVLYLRFLQNGNLAAERRLVVRKGEDARLDLSAFVPEGEYTLELVSWRPFSAAVERRTGRLRDDADTPPERGPR